MSKKLPPVTSVCERCGASFVVRRRHEPPRFCSPECVFPTPEQRFWSKVNKTDSCWLWTGSSWSGYGRFRWEGRTTWAHRVAYMLLVGPIPDGLVIDHLCRIPACVNPAHLEPVTTGENTRRGLLGYELNGMCRHGHDVTKPENVYVTPRGSRTCRVCSGTKDSGRRVGPRFPDRCPSGHMFDEANTYTTKSGSRQCRSCARERARERARELRQAQSVGAGHEAANCIKEDR